MLQDDRIVSNQRNTSEHTFTHTVPYKSIYINWVFPTFHRLLAPHESIVG